MNAYELIERVKSDFESRGFSFERFGNNFGTPHMYESGARFIYLEPTCRHNGTVENVTATISVFEMDKIWGRCSGSLNTLLKVKVPKNASDKVIANRVSKAIEEFNK